MKHVERIERLKRLIKVINKTPDHDFEMGDWGTKTTECGTHACLLGNAALDPVCKRQGLKGCWSEVYPEDTAVRVLDITYETPDGYEYVFSGAGREFFGITDAETRRLFLSHLRLKGKAAKDKKRAQVKVILEKYERLYKKEAAKAAKNLEI